MIHIAIDVPGGDLPPSERLYGCVLAHFELPDLFFHFYGDSSSVKALMNNFPQLPDDHYSIHHAPSVIEMGEAPSHILKQKKDSSLALSILSVHSGESQAIISAGNTGAQMAGSLFFLGRIASIERPSIAISFPTLSGHALLVDAGANSDSKPENLLDSARLGILYTENVLHKHQPTVGLINNGTEAEKGNLLTKTTFPLFKENIPNFIGYVETRNLFSGAADIYVTDGFTGNIILKTIEGTASSIFDLLKQELTGSWRSKIGALLLKKNFRAIKKRMDYRSYGGAPLLGVNGISIICHGSSDAYAFKNAIIRANEMIQMNWIERIVPLK